MKVISASQLTSQTASWEIVATTSKSQIAIMILNKDQVSGKYGSDHPQADQVLYCISGVGTALVEGEEIEFSEGDTILIGAGERHQIKGGPCRTLNVYGPPAYP